MNVCKLHKQLNATYVEVQDTPSTYVHTPHILNHRNLCIHVLLYIFTEFAAALFLGGGGEVEEEAQLGE